MSEKSITVKQVILNYMTSYVVNTDSAETIINKTELMYDVKNVCYALDDIGINIQMDFINAVDNEILKQLTILKTDGIIRINKNPLDDKYESYNYTGFGAWMFTPMHKLDAVINRNMNKLNYSKLRTAIRDVLVLLRDNIKV